MSTSLRIGLAIAVAASTPSLIQAQETTPPPRDTGSSLEGSEISFQAKYRW